MMSWPFTFSPFISELAGDGELRLNMPPPWPGVVTRLYLDNLDRDGLLVRPMLLSYPVGTMIHVQTALSTAWVTLKVTGQPLADLGQVTLPVECVGASPSPLTPGLVEAFFFHTPSSQDAATDADLIDLATAKAHLRIMDTAHDADIQQKIRAASATIRDYLKTANDSSWTPATVPPWIQQSALLLLAHFYEHRGDEFGGANDNDDRVWAAIAQLCRRTRDPALA